MSTKILLGGYLHTLEDVVSLPIKVCCFFIYPYYSLRKDEEILGRPLSNFIPRLLRCIASSVLWICARWKAFERMLLLLYHPCVQQVKSRLRFIWNLKKTANPAPSNPLVGQLAREPRCEYVGVLHNTIAPICDVLWRGFLPASRRGAIGETLQH